MTIQKTKFNKLALFLLAILLLLTSLACQYAGQIVSAAEATQIALPSATPTSDFAVAKYQEGDEVVIVGGNYGALVPLFSEPEGKFFTSQIMNNSETMIQGVRLVGEKTWYQIEGLTGGGWILEQYLKDIGE